MEAKTKGDPVYTIGGSEAAAILGLSHYQTPMDIYCRKLNLVDGPAENEPMRWGKAAEHVVARRYARETGAQLRPSIDQGYDRKEPMVHPLYPWWTGTPDRLVEPDGGLEIKIVGERTANRWTEEEVPDEYLIQCHWYLGLTGRAWWDLAVQISNRDYRVYRILRDEEMLETLRRAAEDFLINHLIPQIPPPLDASESSKRYLALTFPADTEPLLDAGADAEVSIWVGSYLKWKAKLQEAETELAEIENFLKGKIGNHAGLTGPWGKILWKKNKDSERVDVKALSTAHPEIAAQFKTVTPGARVFRPYLKEV